MPLLLVLASSPLFPSTVLVSLLELVVGPYSIHLESRDLTFLLRDVDPSSFPPKHSTAALAVRTPLIRFSTVVDCNYVLNEDIIDELASLCFSLWLSSAAIFSEKVLLTWLLLSTKCNIFNKQVRNQLLYLL